MSPTFDELMNIPCYVVFKRLSGCCGQCIFATHEVRIDLHSQHNIARIFLHELIHLARKGWKESQVLYWEHRLWHHLSYEQVERLYSKLYYSLRVAHSDSFA